MTSDARAPRTLARRVIDAGRSQSPIADDGAPGAAAAACSYLYDELSRWIGSEGCHALFRRALAEARKESPPLQSIQLSRLVPYVQGIDTAVAAHGDAETAASIEVLLIRLVELLGRLIGDDMAMKLIEPVLAKAENSRKKPVTGRGPE